MRNKRLTQQDYMARQMRQRIAAEFVVDAPIGGWNTRETIDNMPPTDAVVLDNWVPDMGAVTLRPGYEEYCDIGTDDDVYTLIPFDNGNPSDKKFFACAGTKIYNITVPSLPSAAITGKTTGKWQWAQFDGKLGIVNGVDYPMRYDPDASPALDQMTISGTGLTSQSVTGINVFKNRTWFWMKESQDVWYSALYTMGGTLTKFPLSRVGHFGGSLVTMQTWTRDGGSGPDDFAVFIMSSGEAIIYQGSSPAVGGDWSIVGVYNIGAPLSQRAAIKFGPDLFMITDLDYVNLSEVLSGMEAKTTRTKANGALQTEIKLNRAQWGWEAFAWPEGRLVFFNIPQGDGVYRQHVLNYVTGAWCRFIGINAHTWCLYDNELYFGATGGKIYRLSRDLYTDDGDPIYTEMQPAWNSLGSGARKTIVGLREFIDTSNSVVNSNRYSVDFERFDPHEFPAPVDDSGTPWGSAWGSPWSSSIKVQSNWNVIHGYGTTVSFQKKMSLKQKTSYLGSTWLYKQGERL